VPALLLVGVAFPTVFAIFDIAKEPTCSPEINFGRYFRFCASLPLRRIWLTQRFEWAP